MLKQRKKILDLKNIEGKRALVRVDFNVPISKGKVEDATRIIRISSTINFLVEKGAKVILISHFGRPKGKFNLEMSLAPIVSPLSEILNKDVKFALDCLGSDVEKKVNELKNGEVLLLENLRFYEGEEKNDLEFARSLAKYGDIYVNDTFSCSHREHASIVGIPKFLPSYSGFLVEEELVNLEYILDKPESPVVAIVGGSKVSTKIGVLKQLAKKVDTLIIGGGMANTFLKASKFEIGSSIYEKDLIGVAHEIMDEAMGNSCEIILPIDVAVTKSLQDRSECRIIDVSFVEKDDIIADIGPNTVRKIHEIVGHSKTVLWNGPIGAFEYRPFNIGTESVVRILAKQSLDGKIRAIAGGGDIVAAINLSGLSSSFSYISTAGGAFLQWLEDGRLVGIDSLIQN